MSMGNGQRRKYNICMCQFCSGSSATRKRWSKHYTHKLDRVEGKEEILDQLDDHRLGIDPD